MSWGTTAVLELECDRHQATWVERCAGRGFLRSDEVDVGPCLCTEAGPVERLRDQHDAQLRCDLARSAHVEADQVGNGVRCCH
ncbi:hypothetical protein D7I44_04060 [Gryllotalpicola protaetiae]|uniref:Uncharacterized protein n=1 Tax=Gryllotalpicola protaetiae TaxID=2419771 RepID=A0A387BFS1_9MICO|nr:hypothetical protein D7I44_04060 [Gryllotalpicola protaetiae]